MATFVLTRFPLKYVVDSAEIYRTKEIKCDILKVPFFESDDEVHLHDRYYDQDDN